MNSKELEQKINNAAHENYPYGSNASIGSKDRSLYEHKNESFIAGAKSPEAAEFHTHALRIEMVAKCAKMLGDAKYTEEQVKDLLISFFNDLVKMKVSNTLKWFEQNKKKS